MSANRAERRRQEREARRLKGALKARGLQQVFTLLPLNDPESERKAAAIVADLDRTLSDPNLDPLVRTQLEAERRRAVIAQQVCATCDPTRPAAEAMN